jgi:hypothetical protein
MQERKIVPLFYKFVFIVVMWITIPAIQTEAQDFPTLTANIDSTYASVPHLADSISKSIDSIAYFYEPYPIEPGRSILQIGGSFTLLPLPVVENEYPAPALDVQYKYGLYDNIILAASLSTNYFSNLLHAGIQWNFNINDLSMGIANDVGGFYGFINTAGQFDENSATAFYYLPIVRIGYRLDAYSISMSWAVSYIFHSYNKVSGLTAEGPQDKINDFFCTLAVEQPFLKHSLISIGFSLNYARSPYQSWMLYNTLDEYLFLPEFFFAFQL